MRRQRTRDREPPDYLRYGISLSYTDRAIVELLQADGRRSYTDIARELGISEKTARKRVQQLLDSGVIQITAVTNPVILGYRASAQVGVLLDGTRPSDDVAAQLARIEAADYVVVATGRYPIYVEVLCRDEDELLEVVDRRIRTTPGVADVETFPYLSIYYQQAQFARAREKSPEAAGVRPTSLDVADKQIIRELSLDGRAPFQQIAKSLEVSESQVRQRFKRLVTTGVVQVIAIVNPMGLEYRTMAWLAVRAAPTIPLVDLAEAFAHLPFVTYIAICTGRFDLFVEVICVSQSELLELLDTEIRRLEGMAALEVALYLRLHYKPLVPTVVA